MAIRMSEMTWMEFNSKIKEGAVTILPIGACEQHAARTCL
ncbi:creatininase family protein [Desulfovibrio piger]|nr:creatininase family protein [Desulfovibrio piger]